MYPEVKECLAAFEAAQEEYDSACQGVPPCDFGVSIGRCPGCAAGNRLRGTLEASRKIAWDALKASASTPLVRWIAENCADRMTESSAVLALLPAPMSALDALALCEGWCDAYQEYRRAAEQAGVLPDTTPSEVVS